MRSKAAKLWCVGWKERREVTHAQILNPVPLRQSFSNADGFVMVVTKAFIAKWIVTMETMAGTKATVGRLRVFLAVRPTSASTKLISCQPR